MAGQEAASSSSEHQGEREDALSRCNGSFDPCQHPGPSCSAASNPIIISIKKTCYLHTIRKQMSFISFGLLSVMHFSFRIIYIFFLATPHWSIQIGHNPNGGAYTREAVPSVCFVCRGSFWRFAPLSCGGHGNAAPMHPWLREKGRRERCQLVWPTSK